MNDGVAGVKESVSVQSGATSRVSLVVPTIHVCQLSDNILFDTARSFVRPLASHKTALQTLLAALNNPGTYNRLLVAGHTDSVGTRNNNQGLSDRRTQSVQAILQSNTSEWETLYNRESWDTQELSAMVIETGEADASDPAAVSQAVSSYQGSTNTVARAGLFQRYFDRLLGGNTVPSYQATTPALLACGEDQLLRGDRLSPSRDTSLAAIYGDFEPNRRAEFFFFDSSPTNINCTVYGNWVVTCSAAPPSPQISVSIASIVLVIRNQTVDVQVDVNPSPLPTGTTITLSLTTTSGNGAANFVSTNANSMTISRSGLVSIRGMTESSATDNIRLSATVTGQTQVVTQEDFTVLAIQIAALDIVGRGQTANVQVTLLPSPMPAGQSVTLQLSTTSGTGQAEFTSGSSATMTINSSTNVSLRGVTESSVVDNIRLSAVVTGQTAALAQEAFSVLSVQIAPFELIARGQSFAVQVTLSPAPLTAGSSVTLALSTTSGTGEARFAATASATMTINNTGPVQVEGVLESSAFDNIQLAARITGQAQTLALEDFAVLFARVTAIDFQSGIDIYSAASNTIVPAAGPEWQRAPPLNHPAAYIRTGGVGAPARTLRVNLTAIPAYTGNLSIRAQGPAGSHVEIGQMNVPFAAGTANNIAMQFSNLPSTVRRLNNIDLQWQFQHTSWPARVDGETTTHTLYIVDTTPVAGVTAYTELLDYSCLWADGLSGDAAVFAAIWNRIRLQAPTGWTYYGAGATNATTRGLINSHNGDCDGWARFMVDCCRVHGITTASHHRIYPTAGPPVTYDGIVVHNVTYGTQYDPGPPRRTFRYTNIPRGYTGLDTSPAGIPGHGVATPGAKVFNFHAVVRRGATYYDPSYMVTWANEAAFRGALAGQLANYMVEWPAGSGVIFSERLVAQL